MTLKKSEKLKTLINSTALEYLMEAHNGLSAKIVENAGFKGIWASGLSISASLGVRDNNEASWTQVLDVLEFMSDATTIPILLDGDTGYGNFNNMRRLVRKLEQRNIAGVCIEDKLFPKTNSFIGGEAQPLADMDEFCGKIKAAKDTQSDNDFVVVARIEAFIAGWGLAEALRRATAYWQAGADALLVHSKKNDSTDIDAFMKAWGKQIPVIIVPTKYYSVPTEHFKDIGVSTIIWANHNLRASIKAMQKTTEQIFKDQHLRNVEDNIVSVSEVFRLQGADELKEAEKKYLPTAGRDVNAIILAASQGEELGALTATAPKTLLDINGKSILENQVEEFNRVGIKTLCVVRGFEKNKINLSNLKPIDNDIYGETKDLYSLYLAINEFKTNTVVSYGDIVFKSYILNDLLNDQNDITLIVDADPETKGDNKDFVAASRKYSRNIFFENVQLKKVFYSADEQVIDGEFIGLWKVNEKGAQIVKSTLKEMAADAGFKQMTVGDMFNKIIEKHPVSIKYIKGGWLDVDTIVDLQKANQI